MKWLFAVLVLANVAFFMWTRWHGEIQDAGREARPEINAKDMRLLSEPGAVRSPRKVAVARANCERLGPLNEAEGNGARAVLEQAAVSFHARQERAQAPAGILVYIAPAADARKAQVKLRELRRKGIKDFALIAEGPKRNAISLGLFTRPELAARYVADLATKGIVAQSEPQTREERQLWIEVETGLPAEVRQRLEAELGAERLQTAPCSATDTAPRL